MAFFKNNYILLLFLISPVGYLVSYLLINIGASNINSYFSLITVLLMSYILVKRAHLFIPFVCILYFLFNVLFFEGNLNSNARETCQFVLFLITMFSMEEILRMIKKLKPADILSFFYYFSICFTILFIVTAAFEGKAVYLSLDNSERSYYNGFVISHMFSYYAILLAFILGKFKNYFWSFILIFLALTVGNRISILTLIATSFVFIEGKRINKMSTFLKVSSYASLFLLIIYLAYVFFYTNYFNWASLSKLLLNPDYQNFTSGRSLFWYNGLNELKKIPMLSFNFFFGLGPDSVEKLAMNLYGQYYWMHNDFMQIVYCYGFVGIFLYILGIYKFSRAIKSSTAFWLILITAMFNGFYTYGAFQLIVMIIVIIQPTFHREGELHKLQQLSYD